MIPPFKLTQHAARRIASEKKTAKAIRLLWEYESALGRKDPDFLLLLMRCAWVNSDQGPDDAGRRLRNKYIASWLDLDEGTSDPDLIKAVVEKMGMPISSARWLVTSTFGITHYYKAFRGHLGRYVVRHKADIAAAFDRIWRDRKDSAKKAYEVAVQLLALPSIRVATGKTSIMNAITPALACLDPQGRFPILNQRTKRLLAALGQKADAEGVRSLSDLVGRWGMKTAFHVDVYSQIFGDKFVPARAQSTPAPGNLKTLGFMSEQRSSAIYEKRKVIIRKRHNQLTNKLVEALSPPFTVNKEIFDALVQEYRKGRKLLIEAKTETEGVLGRTQMRQAVGQLFDYRWREFPTSRDEIDLALLTPKKPPNDMLDLLQDLGIEALWFEGKKLGGTIKLVPEPAEK